MARDPAGEAMPRPPDWIPGVDDFLPPGAIIRMPPLWLLYLSLSFLAVALSLTLWSILFLPTLAGSLGLASVLLVAVALYAAWAVRRVRRVGVGLTKSEIADEGLVELQRKLEP